ncbi:hypothetical protein H072_1151 [Dactylellina haptotyla CBS 200.50]|uniref:PARP catalytic domain-containing protein n=1 Tax=Dactylellina haptotyla (strain CBS 200.50) TaxID=1284197 RepID=S8APK2_DACHA|nr:hypothetical protein H072_1151 [Dactylellina haptotyla CBS 200.50]
MSVTRARAKAPEVAFLDEETWHSHPEIHSSDKEGEEDISECSSSYDNESHSEEPIAFKDELRISTQEVTFTDDELVELSFLREEEIDQMVEAGLIRDDSRFDESLREKLVFSYPEMALTLVTGERYPVFPLSYTIDNISLPRLVVDDLRISLRNMMVTFDDKNAIQRWLTRADNESNYGAFESDRVALNLARKTHEHILSYRSSLKKDPSAPVNIASATSRSEILTSLSGIDPSSYDTSTVVKELLGKSISEVCESIPPHYRILHVENVVKSRLYADFHVVKASIRARLLTLRTTQLRRAVPPEHQRGKSTSTSLQAERRDRESLADFLTTPKCTFHGTQRHAVANIIRHGFLRPGDINPDTKTALEVRCGNTYGRGIYTSPSAHFSLSYSGYEAAPTEASHFSGLKLIVCATIMGRPARVTRADNWRNQSEPYPNADSHVANNEYEYIVFQPRQTIPVLVVHLDWGKEHYEEFASIPHNPVEWIERMRERRKESKRRRGLLDHTREEGEDGGGTLFPADIVRRKQALIARALKWFPYGYGPATGTRFVVEAVADDSDDEEEYGEYQADRVEGQSSGGYFWEMPAVEGEDERFDEFFMERRAKTGRVETEKKKEGDGDDDDS